MIEEQKAQQNFAPHKLSPVARARARAPPPATPCIVFNDADEASVKGIAEFCVIQLVNGSVKVVCCLKFYNAHCTAPIAHNIGVGWLHHLSEVVLQVILQNVLLDFEDAASVEP